MKVTPMTREEAEQHYDKRLRELYPDDAVLAERIKEIEREDNSRR